MPSGFGLKLMPLPLRGRFRNASIRSSSAAQILDTSLREIPSIPRARTRSSTFRVLTPCT